MTAPPSQPYPKAYSLIRKATEESNFTMASDLFTCSLLKTLAAPKRNSKFLELGTGTGLSTSWILDGMDVSSSLVTVDYDAHVLDIAKHYLSSDNRLTIVQSDGGKWLEENHGLRFDFIFADTWHGKYLMLPEALDMLVPGGLYIVDDMLPQKNWPEGHSEKAAKLVEDLEGNESLIVTKLLWSTGIIVAVKK